MINKAIIFLVSMSLFSCQEKETFITKNGTMVTYEKKGGGALPVDSLIYTYSIKYSQQDGKVIFESESDFPQPIKFNPNDTTYKGEFYEVLSKLKVGDDVVFDVTASDLYEVTFQAQCPDSIQSDSKLKFELSCLGEYTEEEYKKFAEQKAKEFEEEQLKIDTEEIDAYLGKNGIEAQKTKSGIRYVIQQQGDGNLPKDGDMVHVHYVGRLLTGELFDTSREEVAKEEGTLREGYPYEAFKFPVGQGRVIKGWDEGFKLLNKGTKATIYIPSTLAYGQRSAGEVIKPNSNLVFEVELMDITTN